VQVTEQCGLKSEDACPRLLQNLSYFTPEQRKVLGFSQGIPPCECLMAPPHLDHWCAWCGRTLAQP
jgi:hypothetical protein